MLDGRIEEPEGKAIGTALFAHCFTCTKQSKAATHISRTLAKHGWRVLRFDFTGLGESEGEFDDAGFVSNIDDIAAAAEALDKAGDAADLLIGHSFGGAAVIAAAERVPSARAVATIGAPFNVQHVLDRLGDQLAAVTVHGEAEVSIGGRPFRLKREFIAQVFDQPQADRLAKLHKALLVMHAPTDDVVGLENAGEIFAAAKHPKSFVALDGADHLLTADGSADYAASVIAAWAAPYARVN
jgi:pimeloyl-ACP methyl ester carboxylesterase